jgi:hypothetical protein
MQVKQETYNQFKDLLFLASPEVKEDVMRLEIGCKIRITDWYGNKFIESFIKDKVWVERELNHIKGRVYKQEWVYVLSDNQKISIQDLNFFKEYPRVSDDDKKIEVIGKDIIALDILRALDSKNDYEKHFMLRSDGMIIDEWLNDNAKYTNIIIDITKPAHLQSELTIQGIITLLK